MTCSRGEGHRVPHGAGAGGARSPGELGWPRTSREPGSVPAERPAETTQHPADGTGGAAHGAAEPADRPAGALGDIAAARDRIPPRLLVSPFTVPPTLFPSPLTVSRRPSSPRRSIRRSSVSAVGRFPSRSAAGAVGPASRRADLDDLTGRKKWQEREREQHVTRARAGSARRRVAGAPPCRAGPTTGSR